MEILLSEAVFSSNSKVSKLTPLQLVTGQQPVLPLRGEATQGKEPFTSLRDQIGTSMHGYVTSGENSHEVKVNFQSTVDIIENEPVGNREYPSRYLGTG